MKSFAWYALAAFVAAMCGLTLPAAHAADVAFSGSAFYRERLALPGNAALVVELIDLAKPNAVLGEIKVAPAGQVPIAFSFAVDSRRLPSRRAYGLKARITVDGVAWFASNKPLRVKPENAGKSGLSLLLMRVTDKGAGALPLAGTAWRLVALDGTNIEPGVTLTLAFNADGSVHGHGGCNNFAGGTTISGTALKFGQLASTSMACVEAKSRQDAAFHAALARTASYALKTGELALLNAAGGCGRPAGGAMTPLQRPTASRQIRSVSTPSRTFAARRRGCRR